MTSFLDHPSPRWFSIGAHRPFLADLARGLAGTLAPLSPEAAAAALVLLPTRRACRELARAFVHVSKSGAAILPQIRALGDLEEGEGPFEPGEIAADLPPPMGPARRRFELAGLVARHFQPRGRALDAGAALDLADALAGFLDTSQIEERTNPEALDTLVEGDLARHWRISAEFLAVALEAWPERLAQLGYADPTARRVALMRRLALAWRERPPASLILAAGSTGAAPAAADLLAVTAGLPSGAVVLPGLDLSLDDAAWAEIDEQHPQNGLRRLLARAGVGRAEVAAWPGEPASSRGRWRRRIISEALRPADRTDDWLAIIGDLRAEGAATGIDPIAEGLAGLTVTTAANEEEEASLAALLLRETLERPDETAALVSPDQGLARRVNARLARWGIVAGSSAGQPLCAFPAGALLALVARQIADPGDPASLLAILKHPLTSLGRAFEELSAARTILERRGLRGPRPRDLAALLARLDESLDRGPDQQPVTEDQRAAIATAKTLARDLDAALGYAAEPFRGATEKASGAARGLTRALEALARRPRGGTGRLWGGADGEAAAGLIAGLIADSEGLPPVTRSGFAELLAGLIEREVVRSGAAEHPRIQILGVLEARLIGATRLILAGLSEGVWPAGAPIDPFLSRPMRRELGLPPPERRIGLSAHDFAQAAAAPEVMLLTARRRAGAPAVDSRWLWRLRVLAKGAGVALPSREDALGWVRALDGPLAEPPPHLAPATRPEPRPPLAARPREMWVTGVETWIRDPYAIYARQILRLSPLAPPDEEVDALIRGTAFHKAFQTFAELHPHTLPENPEAVFEAILVAALQAAGAHERRMARERALARNIAPWVAAFETGRRAGARLHVEQNGEMVLPTAGGDFVLRARADRIEHRGDRADIIDFKTGTLPSAPQVKSGLAPQLTLTAAILAAGGFKDIPARPGELLYVRVSGGRVPGLVERRGERGGESAALAAAALAGLADYIALFDKKTTPYRSWAIPQFMGLYGGDYDHLARVWEWAVIGETDTGSGG
ncbi:MAG TPA: double-strand break repair protein AddB [Caulobacteraceae bacterium]|nr:double-strand break repair protein AddB [Caulobacteraceae bacterium]